jgi:hypothetical protein
MVGLMVDVMCVTKTRCQASICVGPIRDKTYENLHHYMVAQDRVVCYQVAKLHTTMWQSPIKKSLVLTMWSDFLTWGEYVRL